MLFYWFMLFLFSSGSVRFLFVFVIQVDVSPLITEKRVEVRVNKV